MSSDPRIYRSITLIRAALSPPVGLARVGLAVIFGIVCHSLFAVAVLSMVIAMFYGMSESLGRVSWPWAFFTNAALIVQFPLAHSALLTKKGARLLERIVPGGHGVTLSTTSYAIIASAQLLALFVLWTPSGIIWWRAEGAAFWIICSAYTISWLILAKASFDAGVEVQSGALGWLSLMARIRPVFPDMPTQGLFRVIRQPIYVAFAMTLWTVPVWTPDQLVLAVFYTAYCLAAPRRKERRFEARYGARFEQYRDTVPYAVPKRKWNRHAQ